jgi:HSP20 family molecular chaperone IbpA
MEKQNIIYEEDSRLHRFLRSLDDRSRAMFWHLLMRRHAELAELRDAAGLESDMDTLIHIREVLNPRAKAFFGQPVFVFHRLRQDPETGERVFFSWWIESGALPADKQKEPLVDLFENAGAFTLVADVPGILAHSADVSYKNGILALRLPKIRQNREVYMFYERDHKRKEKQPEEHDALKGPAGSALRSLGEVIPGLGRIIEGLAGSEAFQERLRQADREIEHRLRKAPGRTRGAQPEVSASFSARTLAEEHEGITKAPGSGEREEPPADIFDEGDHLLVILEMPGMEESSIRVDISGDVVSVQAQSRGTELRRRVDLPCSVKQVRQQSYRNGILELELER